MPKYCPSCGSELLNPDAVACPTCGGAIRGNSLSAGNNYPEIKNPGLAAVLSFLIPGLGQIYNGQIGKGLIFIIMAFFCCILMVILIGFLLYFILWILNVIDAYKTAEKINRSEFADNFLNLN